MVYKTGRTLILNCCLSLFAVSSLGDTEVTLTAQDFANARKTEATLSDKDFENAKKLKDKLPPLRKMDPMAPGMFEGDIDLNGHTINEMDDVQWDGDNIQRNGLRNYWNRWPNAQIPYALSPSFNSYERSLIAAGISDIHQKTCIRIVPHQGQRDYVYINKRQGCSANVGRIGGQQSVSLASPGCTYKRTVVHEFMHAAGFLHEQARNDRDNHIIILWQNIQPRFLDEFRKYGLNVITHLNTGYDSSSVMHYGPYAYSRNGQRTIIARNGAALGNSNGLSSNDALKLNRMYNCPGQPGPRPRPRPRPRPGPRSVTRPRPRLGCVFHQRYLRQCMQYLNQYNCRSGDWRTKQFIQRNCCLSC